MLGKEALGRVFCAEGIERAVGMLMTGTVGAAREMGGLEGGERLRTREDCRLMGKVVEKVGRLINGVGMLRDGQEGEGMLRLGSDADGMLRLGNDGDGMLSDGRLFEGRAGVVC